MSSCLFSEKIDIDQYDFIYACAQKNFGPSGITLVIAKKELLAQSSTELPNILKYNAHAAENSMLNTPNTFGWYVAGKMFDWYEANGVSPRGTQPIHQGFTQTDHNRGRRHQAAGQLPPACPEADNLPSSASMIRALAAGKG